MKPVYRAIYSRYQGLTLATLTTPRHPRREIGLHIVISVLRNSDTVVLNESCTVSCVQHVLCSKSRDTAASRVPGDTQPAPDPLCCYLWTRSRCCNSESGGPGPEDPVVIGRQGYHDARGWYRGCQHRGSPGSLEHRHPSAARARLQARGSPLAHSDVGGGVSVQLGTATKRCSGQGVGLVCVC